MYNFSSVIRLINVFHMFHKWTTYPVGTCSEVDLLKDLGGSGTSGSLKNGCEDVGGPPKFEEEKHQQWLAKGLSKGCQAIKKKI